MFGAIEAGGTKFVCGVGTGPDDLETSHIPTTSPGATIEAAAVFLRERAGARLRAVGIASFGPIDLDPRSPSYGHVTSTPKPGWSNCNLAGRIRDSLGVPVSF